ncbi:hypothetical protein VNO77_15163 [Canavalia gladiata]|uniref:Uncharacterized protein n=1 Tax=Canavalia gladiata TaxID=3824 RepID=A0AAN9M006_CANGL
MEETLPFHHMVLEPDPQRVHGSRGEGGGLVRYWDRFGTVHISRTSLSSLLARIVILAISLVIAHKQSDMIQG